MIRLIYIFVISFIVADSTEIYDNFYFGEWPVNPNKDDIVGSSLIPDCDKSKKESLCECVSDQDCESGKCFSSPRVGRYCLQGDGTVFPRFVLQDQFREKVDLYDFAGQGKLIIIDISTSWCQPCRDLSGWLANDDLSITKNRNWKKEYDVIKDLVLKNEIYLKNSFYKNHQL